MNEFIKPADLQEKLNTEDAPLIIDVRTRDEYNHGHVSEAVNIPLDNLMESILEISKNQPIVTYCNMHHPGQSRGEKAQHLLSKEGFIVQAIEGGFTEWNRLKLPIESENFRYLDTLSAKWNQSKNGTKMLSLREEPGARRLLLQLPAGGQSPNHEHSFVEEIYVIDGIFLHD